MTQSSELAVGTRLVYKRTGKVVTLNRRKVESDAPAITAPVPFHPGWWVSDGHGFSAGGLADFVIDGPDSGWEVLP